MAHQEAARLGIALVSNAVDIGVRVEVPAVVTDAITDELYEPKLLYTSRHFEDQVRTFCMNPRGVVCTESWGDAVTVNGHSYADPDRKTANTNFALLVSTRFTEPFKEPIEYGKSIARLANMLGRDILVQRLGDLRAGHRTTPGETARAAWWSRRCAPPPPATSASPCPTGICATSWTCSTRWTRCPAGRGRARHAALRGGGEVLLVAARPRRPICRRRWPGSTPSATGPGSPAGWCRLGFGVGGGPRGDARA